MLSLTFPRENGHVEISLPEASIYIYRFLSPSGKSYVGQTKNLQRRITQHLEGTGSKLLLADLVNYGRKEFKIEILEVLPSDDILFVNQVEDKHIERLDCIYPNGLNLRLNRELAPNGQPVDLTCLEITAKYVFRTKDKLCFTVGECSQHRSYQKLLNAGTLSNLKKKRKNSFNFFELKLELPTHGTSLSQFIFRPTVAYEMSIRYNGISWEIIELWHAV